MGDTDQLRALVARRYRHVDIELLQEIDDGVEAMISKNGGDIEAHIRWNKGAWKWVEWVDRVFRPSKRK